MPGHKKLLLNFLKRLEESLIQSPLLRLRMAKSSKLLDCSRFQTVDADLPREILEAIVDDQGPVTVQLRLRTPKENRALAESYAPDSLGDHGMKEPFAGDRQSREHQELYHLLDKRMRRPAELAKRETGVHALWLGYPLLYAAASEITDAPAILAPVFLWPILIDLDLRQEGLFRIGRYADAGPGQFNRAMATWISRQLAVQVPLPSQEELQDLDWEGLGHHLRVLASCFTPAPSIENHIPLRPVPALKTLVPHEGPRLFHAAVLGCFRWPNEALLADLQEIYTKEDCGGVVRGFVTGERLSQPVEVPPLLEEDRYLVTEADFSQELAVWKARATPGLVVHGPPGTGKSQTIVNIIADALAHGHTVLMVCQKQAATRVVLERLRAVNLADLCVEVNDPDSDRLRVFKAIREQVDALPNAVATNGVGQRGQLARLITTLEQELDRHAQALHERQPSIGISYRQMKEWEGRVVREFPTVRELPGVREPLGKLSAQQLDELLLRVANVGNLYRRADPLRNPWQYRQPTVQAGAILRKDVTEILAELARLDAEHVDLARRQEARIGFPEDLDGFLELVLPVIGRLRPLLGERELPGARVQRCWLRALRRSRNMTTDQHLARCQEAKHLAEQVRSTPLPRAWEPICADVKDAQLASFQELAERLLACRGQWWRVFKLSYFQARGQIRRLQPRAVGAGLWTEVEGLKQYVHARRLRQWLRQTNAELIPEVRFQQAEEHAQVQFPSVAERTLTEALWVYRHEQTHSWITQLLDASLSHHDQAKLRDLLTRVENSLPVFRRAKALLDGLKTLEDYLTPQGLQHPRELVARGESIGPWLKSVAEGMVRLDALVALDLDHRQRSGSLRLLLEGLELYETRLAKGEKLPSPGSDLPSQEYGRWWGALVRYTATRVWQSQVWQSHPILLEITPETHADKVRQLGALLAQKRDLEVPTIRALWQATQVSCKKEPWKRWFQLRRSTQGDSKRLREAVELSLPKGLLALRPCWLVNPTTAAQIFPLKMGLFDLVIFDEASQCPLEQAVPLIYRGKRLIVSGDEKQLPPTNFFRNNQVAEESEEEAEDLDQDADPAPVIEQDRRLGVEYLCQAEDLLQAAVGNLPECELMVHYRSEHPALIEFSNHAFYRGRLEAPPARADARSDFRPIVYHHVGGCYECRTNRAEAEKVLELVREIWLGEGDCPTLGVATFNQPQRELIEDRIRRECQQDEAFAVRYAQEIARRESNQDVGFFVKNLENVQGDERDVIIFSTTFGRNPQGRFFRNFGPLIKAGGERRLNVAITRARRQVVIVGSMPVDEIAPTLRAGAAPGTVLTTASYLQLYLAYAQAVSSGDSAQVRAILARLPHTAAPETTGHTDTEFEEEILQVLQGMGCRTDCQVGESGFRIDLAVRHPDPDRGYVLGIECDGATYHSGRAARTRDVWRQEILARRGWKLHRIWSTSWWNDRSLEIEKLKAALVQAVQAQLP